MSHIILNPTTSSCTKESYQISQHPFFLPSDSSYSCINASSFRSQTIQHFFISTQTVYCHFHPIGVQFPGSLCHGSPRPGPLNRIGGSREQHEFSLGWKHTPWQVTLSCTPPPTVAECQCIRPRIPSIFAPDHSAVAHSVKVHLQDQTLPPKKPTVLFSVDRCSVSSCAATLSFKLGAVVSLLESLLGVLLRNSSILVLIITTKNQPNCFEFNKWIKIKTAVRGEAELVSRSRQSILHVGN